MNRKDRAKEIYAVSKNAIPGVSDTWGLIADYIEAEIKKAKWEMAKKLGSYYGKSDEPEADIEEMKQEADKIIKENG